MSVNRGTCEPLIQPKWSDPRCGKSRGTDRQIFREVLDDPLPEQLSLGAGIPASYLRVQKDRRGI